ncbi:MAG TPA: ribonuclease III [Bacteroidia bacterium]|nr:ribonuclease III [Bacteroidia bacterium]
MLLRFLIRGKDKGFESSVKNLLGFKPRNISLYKQAFRHHSASSRSDYNDERVSNERLEFLGDAVLSSIIAEVLFITYPTKGEGYLTEMRAKIVSRENLCELARKMGIENFMEYDKSIKGNFQIIRSISGNAFEALIGAIYLDKGYNFTRKYISTRILKHHVDIQQLAVTEVNFKSKLIEWCQKGKKAIEFETVEERKQGKQKSYLVAVKIDGEEMGRGEDFSKKKAEQLAAGRACAVIFAQ